MRQFGELGLAGPMLDELIRNEQSNTAQELEQIRQLDPALQPDSVNDAAHPSEATTPNMDEAIKKLEADGGIDAHKNRYGPNGGTCPFLSTMGKAGLDLVESLEKVKATPTPAEGKSLEELVAEKRAAKAVAKAAKEAAETKETAEIIVHQERATEVAAAIIPRPETGLIKREEPFIIEVVKRRTERSVLSEAIVMPEAALAVAQEIQGRIVEPVISSPVVTNVEVAPKKLEDLKVTKKIPARPIIVAIRKPVSRTISKTIVKSAITSAQKPKVLLTRNEVRTIKKPTVRVLKNLHQAVRTYEPVIEVAPQAILEFNQPAVYRVDEAPQQVALEQEADVTPQILSFVPVASIEKDNQTAAPQQVQSEVLALGPLQKDGLALHESVIIHTPAITEEISTAYVDKLEQDFTLTLENKQKFTIAIEGISQLIQELVTESAEAVPLVKVKEVEVLCKKLFDNMGFKPSDEMIKSIIRDLKAKVVKSAEQEDKISMDILNYRGTSEHRAKVAATLQSHLLKMASQRRGRFHDISKIIVRHLHDSFFGEAFAA